MKNAHPVIRARTTTPVESETSSCRDSTEPIIRLKVDKPPHWAWELTTSADALPVIQLLDRDGRLLVETTGRTAQRARGSFREGLKTFEEFPSRDNSSISRDERPSRSSSVTTPSPAVPALQGNRNIDGFSTKFGPCDFGYRPRKSRSDVSVGLRPKKEPTKARSKRYSSGVEDLENDAKRGQARYSSGDYLRQQILDDLRRRSTVGKSPEEIARDRCRKVKAYLRTQSDVAGKSRPPEDLTKPESPAKEVGDVTGDSCDTVENGRTKIEPFADDSWRVSSEDGKSGNPAGGQDVAKRTSRTYQRRQTDTLPRNNAIASGMPEKRGNSLSREDSARGRYNGPEVSGGNDPFSRWNPREKDKERKNLLEEDYERSGEKKPRICSRSQSDVISRDNARNEQLERIKAFLCEKISQKMNEDLRRSGSLAKTDVTDNLAVRKRYSDYVDDDRKNYRTRKVRSETNIVRFYPEKFEKTGKECPTESSSRSSSRQRVYRPSRSDVVLEVPEVRTDSRQQSGKMKRETSSAEGRKIYRKTKSDLLLGQITSSVESEKDFGEPPRRIRSQDNVERSWREYKERKKHERLHRDSEKDVTEEDFMSKPRWKDLQHDFCPTTSCKVCQNFQDCSVPTGMEISGSKEPGPTVDQAIGSRGTDKRVNSGSNAWDEALGDKISRQESTEESRPGTSLQENYLLVEPGVPGKIVEEPILCRVQAKTHKNLTLDDPNSTDFGYNSMQKNLFKDYKELCARSNVKKSDTFKIVDGSEDPEGSRNQFHDNSEGNFNPTGNDSLRHKSNEDIAKDYFKRVYELLKKRQMESRRTAEGSEGQGYEDSSSSNYVEDIQRKRPRRRKKDKIPEGEEVVAVPPSGVQDCWRTQQQQPRLSTDNSESNCEQRRACRSRLQAVSGNRRHRPAPPPPAISAKVNAKDISKYFGQPNKENTPGNAPGERETLSRDGKENEMGSNLSRHNGKGLTGRRTQSSGNLCDPKGKLNSVGKILVPCSTTHKERYKFCGSLPNHLDDKDVMDDERRENNNVMSDTMSGNLGGTLPHKKRSLGVHFSDGGPTGTLDLVKHRSQDSLDENDPWRYHQSDLDLVKCRHGNFDAVRRNRSADTVAVEPPRRYTRLTSTENRCQRSADLDLVGPLPRRKQDPRGSCKSIETSSTSSSHPSSAKDSSQDEELLMKVLHKPDCELMKARQPGKCVDLKLGKLAGGEPQDQGYASERSPEDEHPPSLPGQPFPSVIPESTFRVTLQKSSRGLGLSVSGGGTDGPVRVKRLFPQQPAALSNKLQAGDILLAANGIPLTGLTNYEALEVLRTTSSTVELVVCRLPGDTNVTPPGTPPPPPARREPPPPLRILNPLPPLQIEPCGEFDIEMTKVGGSLGFTLRKADSSALGHYVRALVREPALSDGRIRPGDKIVAVDGAPLSPMSHEEAVALLRQCGPKVKLRLYRDLAQTPVSALSPTEPDHPLRPPRTSLRQEAVDMLCDLAVRKLSPGTSSGSSCRQSSGASCNSPRRVRRLATRTPVTDNEQDSSERMYEVQTTSTGSQMETSDSEQCSIKTQITNSQPNTPGTDIIDPPALYDECDECDSSRPLARPSFLDLSAPQDKPHFQFSLESDSSEFPARPRSSDSRKSSSLDVDVDYERRDGPRGLSSDEQDNDLPSEPASMPPILSSAGGTGNAGFSYKNPAYQSANPACGSSIDSGAKSKATHSSDQDIPGRVLGADDPAGTKGLLKWKGVMFAPDDGLDRTKNEDKTERKTTESAGPSADPEQGNEVFMVELTRGWNSRLGFSLQPEGNRTVISVVHPDSVAAKDGRLKQGDVLLMVNDESVESMSTADIIDLLRKIRGSIGITVMRRCNRENAT